MSFVICHLKCLTLNDLVGRRKCNTMNFILGWCPSNLSSRLLWKFSGLLTGQYHGLAVTHLPVSRFND